MNSSLSLAHVLQSAIESVKNKSIVVEAKKPTKKASTKKAKGKAASKSGGKKTAKITGKTTAPKSGSNRTAKITGKPVKKLKTPPTVRPDTRDTQEEPESQPTKFSSKLLSGEPLDVEKELDREQFIQNALLKTVKTLRKYGVPSDQIEKQIASEKQQLEKQWDDMFGAQDSDDTDQSTGTERDAQSVDDVPPSISKDDGEKLSPEVRRMQQLAGIPQSEPEPKSDDTEKLQKDLWGNVSTQPKIGVDTDTDMEVPSGQGSLESPDQLPLFTKSTDTEPTVPTQQSPAKRASNIDLTTTGLRAMLAAKAANKRPSVTGTSTPPAASAAGTSTPPAAPAAPAVPATGTSTPSTTPAASKPAPAPDKQAPPASPVAGKTAPPAKDQDNRAKQTTGLEGPMPTFGSPAWVAMRRQQLGKMDPEQRLDVKDRAMKITGHEPTDNLRDLLKGFKKYAQSPRGSMVQKTGGYQSMFREIVEFLKENDLMGIVTVNEMMELLGEDIKIQLLENKTATGVLYLMERSGVFLQEQNTSATQYTMDELIDILREMEYDDDPRDEKGNRAPWVKGADKDPSYGAFRAITSRGGKHTVPANVRSQTPEARPKRNIPDKVKAHFAHLPDDKGQRDMAIRNYMQQLRLDMELARARREFDKLNAEKGTQADTEGQPKTPAEERKQKNAQWKREKALRQIAKTDRELQMLRKQQAANYAPGEAPLSTSRRAGASGMERDDALDGDEEQPLSFAVRQQRDVFKHTPDISRDDDDEGLEVPDTTPDDGDVEEPEIPDTTSDDETDELDEKFITEAKRLQFLAGIKPLDS